jgi:hypothetical protein
MGENSLNLVTLLSTQKAALAHMYIQSGPYRYRCGWRPGNAGLHKVHLIVHDDMRSGFDCRANNGFVSRQTDIWCHMATLCIYVNVPRFSTP